MLTIYHNPRCSKSREGLQLIQSLNLPFTIHKYLDTPLTKDELADIIGKLGIQPIDLVRQKEDTWKQNFKGKDLTPDQVIDAMVKHPNLIERPIIVNGNKAIVARPSEKVQEIL